MQEKRPSTEMYALILLGVFVFLGSYVIGQVSVPVTAMAAADAHEGILYVSSSPPGAFIYVGKVYHGETPVAISLNEGAYNIIVSKKGYENYSGTVTVSSGTKTLSVGLRKSQ